MATARKLTYLNRRDMKRVKNFPIRVRSVSARKSTGASQRNYGLGDHDDFQVTLAELYAKSGQRDQFVPLFGKLYIDLDHNPIEQARLLQIAAGYISDDPLVRASLRDAGVDD